MGPRGKVRRKGRAGGLAYNSTDDQYLVAWSDTRDYGTRGNDIYGRRAAG